MLEILMGDLISEPVRLGGEKSPSLLLPRLTPPSVDERTIFEIPLLRVLHETLQKQTIASSK